MFEALRKDIAEFKRSAIPTLQKEVEEWYKDEIRLGGIQRAKGIIGEVHHRWHSYPHPPLMETGQLVNSIKAKVKGNMVIVEHDVTNYRGKEDYGAIQNKRYKFMKPSKPLTLHLEQLFAAKIKKIFK